MYVFVCSFFGFYLHIFCFVAETNGVYEFAHQMYVTCFRNLTADGTVSHSHEFFRLFPDISQISDPRSVAVIPQICGNIKQDLKNKGMYLPEVDAGKYNNSNAATNLLLIVFSGHSPR